MILLLLLGLLMMAAGGYFVYDFIQGMRQDDRETRRTTLFLELLNSTALWAIGTFGLGLIFVLIWVLAPPSCNLPFFHFQ